MSIKRQGAAMVDGPPVGEQVMDASQGAVAETGRAGSTPALDTYTCPVCDYDKMHFPPRDFNICPRCYNEFGYEDSTHTHVELRAAWVAKGSPNYGEMLRTRRARASK